MPNYCDLFLFFFSFSFLFFFNHMHLFKVQRQDLGASVTFLTSQVESLTSAQAERSATPSPPATSNLEASLKDLSSRVAALSSHRATQVAPQQPHAPPPPAPAAQAKPAQQKKKLATRLTSRTVAAPDFPFLFEGKWYGNPDTYAKRHPDSP